MNVESEKIVNTQERTTVINLSQNIQNNTNIQSNTIF
jgi:hypothetical protein